MLMPVALKGLDPTIMSSHLCLHQGVLGPSLQHLTPLKPHMPSLLCLYLPNPGYKFLGLKLEPIYWENASFIFSGGD